MPVEQSPSRAANARITPFHLLVVVLGGAAGTAARTALGLAFPARGDVDWVVFAINVGGAFCLGWLLEVILRAGHESSRATLMRLGLGVGVLGGFTTYSTFALDVATALRQGALTTAATYAALTLLGGLAAAALGMRVGRPT